MLQDAPQATTPPGENLTALLVGELMVTDEDDEDWPGLETCSETDDSSSDTDSDWTSDDGKVIMLTLVG